MITITFPDKSVKQFEDGVTPLQIAQSLSSQLARDVLAASVNEEEWDLTRPIHEDATIKLFKQVLLFILGKTVAIVNYLQR